MSGQHAPRGFYFRTQIALALTAAGLHVTPRPRDVGRLSERLATLDERGPVSDFDGADAARFVIHARADVSPRWGTALDHARRDADLSGRDFAALVQYRRQRTPDEAFVVMSVSDFARLASEAASAA